MIRRDELERRISGFVPGSPWQELVPRLRCLRGIDTLSEVGLCGEVGDFERFARPGELMSYLGLVPAEPTGGKQRLGAITNRARARAPALGRGLALPARAAAEPGARQASGGTARALIAIARKAQQRSHRRTVPPDESGQTRP